jgi:hypothetical protein
MPSPALQHCSTASHLARNNGCFSRRWCIAFSDTPAAFAARRILLVAISSSKNSFSLRFPHCSRPTRRICPLTRTSSSSPRPPAGEVGLAKGEAGEGSRPTKASSSSASSRLRRSLCAASAAAHASAKSPCAFRRA